MTQATELHAGGRVWTWQEEVSEGLYGYSVGTWIWEDERMSAWLEWFFDAEEASTEWLIAVYDEPLQKKRLEAHADSLEEAVAEAERLLVEMTALIDDAGEIEQDFDDAAG